MTLKHFLTRTAVAAAVVAIAGAAGAAEKQMTADIVVVGGGAAGMAAVTQAVDAGKKAILLEKERVPWRRRLDGGRPWRGSDPLAA